MNARKLLAGLKHYSARRFDGIRSLLRPLAVGLAVVLLLLGFALIAGEVFEGETHGLDMRVLRKAHALREAHPAFAIAMRDISGLGGTTVLTLFTVATAGYLLLVRARVTAALVVLSALGGALLVTTLKPIFGRLRPDTAFADYAVWGMSFPSGHASMSAAIYLTLGALSATTRARFRERIYILATASALALLIGVSRIALGVHWVTDVLAGWALGTAWAMGWLLIAFRFVHSEIVDSGKAP